VGWYEIVATILVIAMPLALLAIALGVRAWARDALDHDPKVAVVGIIAACAAGGNLLVSRDLGPATTRPALALFLERGATFRSALLAMAVALLLVAATSVAVRRPWSDLRR
jgi:hypothetical protein